MQMRLMDLNDGVIKLSLNNSSFLIDTEKNIDKITGVGDLCLDGTLVVECLVDGNKAIRWLNLAEYFHLIQRDDVIAMFKNISNCVLVS